MIYRSPASCWVRNGHSLFANHQGVAACVLGFQFLPVKLVAPFCLVSFAKQALVEPAFVRKLFVLLVVDSVALGMHPPVADVAANHRQVRVVGAVDHQARRAEITAPEQHRAPDAQRLQKGLLAVARLVVLVSPFGAGRPRRGGAARLAHAAEMAHPPSFWQRCEGDAVCMVPASLR